MKHSIKKGIKTCTVNLSLFVLTTLLCLSAIDTVLFFFTQTRFNWRKIEVRTATERGSLYYIERDINYFHPRTEMLFETTKEYIRSIPDSIYIPMDVKSRRKGFFRNRPKQAAIVGDSFTQGEGVLNKETLGWFLGREYKEYNFLNYGKSGCNATQVCKIIKDQIIPQKNLIRNVIYFYNINDICDEWPAKTITDFENISYQDMPLAGFWKNSTVLSLIKRAILMRRETKNTIDIYSDLYLGHERDFNTNTNIREISQINKELKRLGIKLHIVIYPLLHKDILGRYPLKPIHETLIARFRNQGISCFDALAAFRDNYFMSRLRVNPADYHPNGKANRLVARFVKENIRLTN